MQTFLRKNKSDELILLFNGWGMDEKPFAMMKSFRDILFVSNYNNLNFDFDFSPYKKIILLAFSAGVFMSAYLKDKLPKLDLKIAINGTLHLFDLQNGIDQKTLEEMHNLTMENVLELRAKLILSEAHFRLFNQNQPLRDLKSSLDELKMLEKYYCDKTVSLDFDKVIMGEHDKIIHYENQIKAWSGINNIKTVNGGHFSFYLFKDFDEIINL